jgi:hypothetical protein
MTGKWHLRREPAAPVISSKVTTRSV